jgi:hypothetical protein
VSKIGHQKLSKGQFVPKAQIIYFLNKKNCSTAGKNQDFKVQWKPVITNSFGPVKCVRYNREFAITHVCITHGFGTEKCVHYKSEVCYNQVRYNRVW